MGGVIFVGWAVNNKLLVIFSAIGAQQAAATEANNGAVDKLLYYVATHPNNGLLFRASEMILAAHSDAGFNNETKGRSRSVAHIFLSRNLPIPPMNGAVLTIEKLSSLWWRQQRKLNWQISTPPPIIWFLCNTHWLKWDDCKKISHADRQLNCCGIHKQDHHKKAIKSCALKLWWIRDRESQDQFNYYWDPVPDNEGDYSTKHHPPIYHVMKRRRKYMV